MRLSALLERFPAPVRIAVKRWRRARSAAGSVSAEYRILEGEVPADLLRGFADPPVAERQQAAFAPILASLREGRPREDFLALAEAVSFTGLQEPLVLEVGCGGGWNAEVLERLTRVRARYVGLDYSRAMVSLAGRLYPQHRFVQADAARLPVRDGAADIVISGTVLMHLLHYREAIAETRRASRRWCVFHTVPVTGRRPTTLLEKRAYGSRTIEVILQEGELLRTFEAHGLRVRRAAPSIPYDLEDVLGERTVTRTYLCEVDEPAAPR